MSRILAFNWKMNPTTRSQVKELTATLQEMTHDQLRSRVIVCPPSIYLSSLHDQQEKLPFHAEIGGQDIATEEQGAFTGQISAPMLQDMGIIYTLIGHSETRKYQHVSNQIVKEKTQQAFAVDLIPIICIGYTHEQDQDVDYDGLRTEIQAALDQDDLHNKPCIIAYEPIWAIGTGKTATPEMIDEVFAFIDQEVQALRGETVPLLYGGSVNHQNMNAFLTIERLDGFLVGGASLDPEEVKAMIKIMEEDAQK